MKKELKEIETATIKFCNEMQMSPMAKKEFEELIKKILIFAHKYGGK